MAATAVARPLDSITRRQSISEANHVNRIRSAHSNRIMKLLSSTEIISYPQTLGLGHSVNESDESVQERASMTDMQEHHKFCIPIESLEELNKNKSNQNLEGTHSMTEKERKSSILPELRSRSQSIVSSHHAGHYGEREIKSSVSPKLNTSRKQSSHRAKKSHHGENVRNSTERKFKENNEKISRKTSAKTDKTGLNQTEKSRKKVSRKSLVKTDKTGLKQTTKMQSAKRKQSASIRSEERLQKDFSNKQKSVPRSNEFDSDELIEISEKENTTALKDSHSSKDAIVLKWLHEINCPLTPKEENASDSQKVKKSPVRALKKPLKTTMDKTTKEFSVERKPSNASKLPVRKTKMLLKDSKELDDSYSETKKRENVSTEEITKDIPNVEMHVSELGKLQIILDPKTLSHEDAAIIIWLEDIPESFFVPKYHRRLSLASIPNLRTPGVFTETVRSESALEDTASKKPDIYFPPVTILKNIAVGSKHGLRVLDETDEKSVYYKRCNISHVDWDVK